MDKYLVQQKKFKFHKISYSFLVFSFYAISLIFFLIFIVHLVFNILNFILISYHLHTFMFEMLTILVSGFLSLILSFLLIPFGPNEGILNKFSYYKPKCKMKLKFFLSLFSVKTDFVFVLSFKYKYIICVHLLRTVI